MPRLVRLSPAQYVRRIDLCSLVGGVDSDSCASIPEWKAKPGLVLSSLHP